MIVLLGMALILFITWAVLAAVGKEGVITSVFSNWFTQV